MPCSRVQSRNSLSSLAEECRAPRVVEGERGQRVEDGIAADVAAIVGLHAQDRDDHFPRYAQLGLRAVERRGVLVPERDAGVDPLGVEKARRVFIPLRGRKDRAHHGRDHLWLIARVREQPPQRARIEAFVGSEFGDERAHLRTPRVVLWRRRRSGGPERRAREGEPQRQAGGARAVAA